MADVKISGLPTSTTPLAGTEVLPIVQSGATKQVSVANLTAGRDISASSLTTTGNITSGNPVGLASTGVTAQSNGFILQNTSGTNFTSFYYSGTNVGSITTNGIITLYNTTSDRRLKTNIVSITPEQSGQFVDALLPRIYNRTIDNSVEAGFIADEFQKVAPVCVTGLPDEVDEKGNPIYQMLDASTPQIIAYLVAEIQSLRARLKTANIA
jgi:hypothetical protein